MFSTHFLNLCHGNEIRPKEDTLHSLHLEEIAEREKHITSVIIFGINTCALTR